MTMGVLKMVLRVLLVRVGVVTPVSVVIQTPMKAVSDLVMDQQGTSRRPQAVTVYSLGVLRHFQPLTQPRARWVGLLVAMSHDRPRVRLRMFQVLLLPVVSLLWHFNLLRGTVGRTPTLVRIIMLAAHKKLLCAR